METLRNKNLKGNEVKETNIWLQDLKKRDSAGKEQVKPGYEMNWN